MKIGLDYIKIKDFFKVLETNDFRWLPKNQRKKYTDVWPELLEEYETLSGGNKVSKEITTKGRIEALKCKFNAIQIACQILSFSYKEEVIEILKENYFFINKSNYQNELDRIKKESESILIQIKRLEKQLPKEKETTNNKSQHIDQVILGYCSFVGIQIKPNKCTVTEFLSLKNLFEDKLKQLEKPQK